MNTETHPDPLAEAMQHGIQRAVQIASAIVTGAQVYIYHKKTQARTVAERNDQARRALNAQARAEQQAHRAQWAPALDHAWLREADLLQAARAWSAAMPYADRAVPWYEPAAATAMRKCEERLRELHPYAMAYYDRLRGDGLAPAEAMQQAAPLFARPPRAHDGSSTAPRPALHRGDGEVGSADSAPTPGGLGDPSAGQATAERDRAATAEQVRAADLDAATDLKDIPSKDERTENLVGAGGAEATANAAIARAASIRPGRSSRPWERDFPLPIHDVVATASRAPAPASSRSAGSQAPSRRATKAPGPRP
jgi:hypothetical protein